MSALASGEWLDGMVQARDGCFGVIVHPSPKARAIIVNVPGYRGDIDGYNRKYRTLGAHLAARQTARSWPRRRSGLSQETPRFPLPREALFCTEH